MIIRKIISMMQDAIAELKALISKLENTTEYDRLLKAYIDLGVRHWEKEEYQEAIDITRKALDLPPNNNTKIALSNLAKIYITLGNKHLKGKQDQEAIDAFTKA